MEGKIRAITIQWKSYIALNPVTLIDGQMVTGVVMRRKVDGIWQYRQMSEEEEHEYVSRDAW